jgi:hypothetical protein
MRFRGVAQTSDVDGPVGWSDVSRHTAVTGMAIGSRYTPPAGHTLALPFATGASNARIDIWNGADHLTPNPLTATLAARTLTGKDASLRRVSFVPQTGLFSGAAILDGKAQPFFGVMFQAQNLGAGYCTTADGTAALQLVSPATAASADNHGVNLALPPANN